jgi:SnoaL-like domain
VTDSDAGGRNLDAVRRYLEGSVFEPELAAEFFEPDADYYPTRLTPEAGPRHGRAAIAAFFREWLAGWSTVRNDLLEIDAIGDDRVLAKIRIVAQGFSSGMNIDGEVFICVWLRHGRFIRVEDHLTERGARHALGLEE